MCDKTAFHLTEDMQELYFATVHLLVVTACYKAKTKSPKIYYSAVDSLKPTSGSSWPIKSTQLYMQLLLEGPLCLV